LHEENPMSLLFSPLQLRSLKLANRVQVSPMCQYSAVDGSMTDWHLMHYGGLALSGAGLLVMEATHVTAQGRITHGCSGLYSDENQAALDRVLRFCRAHSGIAIGVQLGHAGRKASTERPWDGAGSIPARDHEGPWETVAPSALPGRRHPDRCPANTLKSRHQRKQQKRQYRQLPFQARH
jgi:2,4-dienoyl-CoA reductase-like NADH-dependent reductase (Old Yellow Enzyme family)